MDRTARIRLLNDLLRTTFHGGRIMMTSGVAALEAEVRAAALEKLRTFAAFTEDNDPHGEHDFGDFTVEGVKFFFKFDYYDLRMEFGSEDPGDPTKTTRVLTLMLAEEY